MKRILDNLQVDLVAAALMLAMVATGYILRFPLPPGTNKYLTLWGLTRHQWGTVHLWISTALLLLVVLHVCLHWKWVVVTVKRRFWGAASPPKSPLKSGLLTAVVILAGLTLFGWAAHLSVRPISGSVDKASSSSGASHASSSPESGGPPATPAATPVAYWRDVYPILENSCSSCHGPTKQISGFRVDRREAFFEGKTPLVIAGNSRESPLIQILSGQRDIARADVHRLPEDQVAVVASWVDAGAEWLERPSD